MTRTFLGLGSNLGDRVDLLQDAVASLDGVVAVSPVYETDPMGGPDEQGSFLNLVVELDTTRNDITAALDVALAVVRAEVDPRIVVLAEETETAIGDIP